MTSLAGAFEQVLSTLDRFEIPFFIGGSVASGVYGLPRQTNDIDIVAAIPTELIREFCAALAEAFYADPDAAEAAFAQHRAFNLVHLSSGYKFDIFPASQAFPRSELARRFFTASTFPDLKDREFPVSTAEDTVLAKLHWFRAGGETSDRQWSDILGIVRTQGSRLDRNYLDEWARQLGVLDLLAKALAG